VRTGRYTPCAAALLALLAGCDRGRDRVLSDVQSQRPEERAAGIRNLSLRAKAEDLAIFTRGARDPAAIVRAESAEALGRTRDPKQVDVLGELLNDPDEAVQARAAMALAAIRSDKAKAYLISQYARRGRATREVIVQALKAADVPGAMAAVVSAEAAAIWQRNLRALSEGSLAERVSAADELGKSGRPEAVDRLVEMMRAPQVILVAAAVRGLGQTRDPRVAEPISKLLVENFPDLREAVCESLLELQDSNALAKLREVAIEKSAISALATAAIIALPRMPEVDNALCEVVLFGAPAETLAAGREMGRRGGCPMERLLRAFPDAADRRRPAKGAKKSSGADAGSPPTVPAALRAIAALGAAAREAMAYVIPLIGDRSRELNRLALEAAAQLRDPAAAAEVRKAYDEEIVRVGALRARWIPADLSKRWAPGFEANSAPQAPAGSDQAKQAELLKRVKELNASRSTSVAQETSLPAELADDVSPDQLRLLASALRALGMTQAPEALQLLRPYLRDPSPALRSAAIEGLAFLDKEGIALARQGLVDSDRNVQSIAAAALAEQGEAGALAVLEALGDARADRLRLLEALQHHKLPESAGERMVQLVAGGGAEASFAAQILGDLKAKEAVPALVKYLEDPSGVARREVLVALGRIGDPRAAPAVARDLWHDSAEMRAAAAEALASMGGAAQMEALEALRADYYRRVRDRAELAIAKITAAASEARR
jgi:HEAT repeat protein